MTCCFFLMAANRPLIAFVSPSYDPLALAVAELEAEGYPKPEGFEVVEVEPGTHGDALGHTDTDDKEIEIDVAGMISLMEGNGSASPPAVIGALKMLLRHEYHHTEDYGEPTPDPGGYSNGICAHMDLLETDLDYYCNYLICEEPDAEARDAMCEHHNDLTDLYNGYLVLRNNRCPGAKNRRFACPCCD